MRYVECPTERSGAGQEITLFLAGGITNCPDWQKEMTHKLGGEDVTLLNPRRQNWGTADVSQDPAVIEYAKELSGKEKNLADMLACIKDLSERKPKDWEESAKAIERNIDPINIRIEVCKRRLDELTLAGAQIEWEHRHLTRSDATLFWFPCETLCPITLYELGAWNFRPKKLFIGCHPDYERKLDVQIQTRLERPLQVVASSLDELTEQVKEWLKIKLQNHSARTPDQPTPKTI